MDYYEELGLPVAASTEDIQQAYRRLSRLLHPDHQQEEELKRLAECQMRRLNQIYTTLSDPEQRRRYDFERQGNVSLVRLDGSRRIAVWPRRVSQVAWTLAAGACVVVISWYVSGQHMRQVSYPVRTERAGEVLGAGGAMESREPPRHSARVSRSPRPQPPLRVGNLRNKLPRLRTEARGATPFSAPVETSREPDRPAELLELYPHLPSVNRDPPKPDSSAAGQRPGLAGAWFYAPPRHATRSSLYSPQFIEAVISEDGTAIRGRYRARYQVPDRAISPDVAFSFEGEASKDQANLEWRGAGGSRGNVSLRLMSDYRLEVRWSASELGSDMGLSAGTAVLVRQPNP